MNRWGEMAQEVMELFFSCFIWETWFPCPSRTAQPGPSHLLLCLKPQGLRRLCLGLSAMQIPGLKLRPLTQNPHPGPVPRESELCSWDQWACFYPAPSKEQVSQFWPLGPSLSPVGSTGSCVPESWPRHPMVAALCEKEPGNFDGCLPGTCWVQATQRLTQLPMALR